MSYSLTPVLVDLAKVQAAIGSNDEALLRAVVKKHRKEMLETDALGEDFEDFEDEIEAQYQAMAAGDFSSVELNGDYGEAEEQATAADEGMPELVDEIKNLDISDPAAMQQFLEKHGSLLEGLLGDVDEDEDDEDQPSARETTTGEALAHLILGGKPDWRSGYKYGYALLCLCEHLGEAPEHDSWCSIRNAAFVLADQVLAAAGIDATTFSTSKHLVNRRAPVKIPTPDDFPFIGYLTRDEIGRILSLWDAAKLEAAAAQTDDDEWVRGALDELHGWLEASVQGQRDLVCFYF